MVVGRQRLPFFFVLVAVVALRCEEDSFPYELRPLHLTSTLGKLGLTILPS